MLNINAICNVKVEEYPFRWIQCLPFFQPNIASEIAQQFPTEQFQSSVGRDNHYKLWDRTLVDAGKVLDGAMNDLSVVWQELVATLISPEYKVLLGNRISVDLQSLELKIRLCKYSAGCWMLPHTDQTDRVVTQIIYLTENWQPAWGGALQILRSSNEKDIVKELYPLFNSMVAFVRSDTSWHAVAPVPDNTPVMRKSILVQYVQPTN